MEMKRQRDTPDDSADAEPNEVQHVAMMARLDDRRSTVRRSCPHCLRRKSWPKVPAER